MLKQLRQSQAYAWALCKLTTIGEACRAIGREVLRTTLSWAVEFAAAGWSKERVIAYLGLSTPEAKHAMNLNYATVD